VRTKSSSGPQILGSRLRDDVFAEAYTVLSLSGVVATPDGPKEIPRKYRLRTSASWADKALINSEYIFFIINNRKRYDPIVRLLPVRSGIVHHHVQSLKKIISITANGELLTESKFNKCDIGEYHTYYNSEESLDNVLEFTCADGTQWVRGNERPDAYIERSIKKIELMRLASNYLRDRKLPSPDLSSGYAAIVNKPLHKSTKINEWSNFRDEIFSRSMQHLDDDTWASMRKRAPEKDRNMIGYVLRELARGKKNEHLPRRAQPFIAIAEKARFDRRKKYQEIK